MSPTRQTVTRAVRTGVGLVGVAAAVSAILLAGRLDLPDIGVAPASTTVEPVAAGQSRVCAGPLVELGQDAAAATAATTVGDPDVVGGTGVDGPAATTTVQSPDDTAGRAGPTLLTAEPAEPDGILAGAQSTSADAERLSGLALSACTEPTAESWLVGGSTDVGQSSVVGLVNPSTVDASVTIEVFGENGPVETAGSTEIVVAAGTQRILSLAGIAPNVVLPVLHVTSVGAPVAATLQQSTVRSISAEGAEVVGASAAPAMEQVVPGFVVPVVRPVEGASGYDARVPGVRILAPGRFDGEVTVTVMAADGTTVEPRSVRAPGGAVVDVPLDDLPAGAYHLMIASDEPVVVAAHSTSSRDDAVDFAWFAGAQALQDDATFAVAAGPSTRVDLVNATDEDRTVVLTTADGSDEFVVPAGSSVRRNLTDGRVYTLVGVGGLRAAVTALGAAGFSSYPLAPPSAASDPVVVRTR